jgi:hypothetical protein
MFLSLHTGVVLFAHIGPNSPMLVADRFEVVGLEVPACCVVAELLSVCLHVVRAGPVGLALVFPAHMAGRAPILGHGELDVVIDLYPPVAVTEEYGLPAN